MFNKVFGEIFSEVATVLGSVGGGKAEITLSIFLLFTIDNVNM